EPVALLAALTGFGAVDRRGMHLAVHRQTVGLGADRLTEAPPVLLDVCRGVGGEEAQVQRLVGAVADAAVAGRESHLVGARRIPPEQGNAHRASARARCMRASRVFSVG